MKIATYNINGINGRLPRLLEWLETSKPDVVCLQELKTVDASFPHAALRKAGYRAICKGERAYNGVAILSRDKEPLPTRRELPGAPKDKQSRYLEAAVNGVLIACLYAPNGNPQPGPKFDYKLAWLERLRLHAKSLQTAGVPVNFVVHYSLSFGSDAPSFEYRDGTKTRELPMRSLVTVNSTDSYLAACLAGLGIIQAPRHGMVASLAAGALVEVLPEKPCAPMPVALVHSYTRNVPKHVRAVLDWLAQLLAPHLA